MNVGRELAPPGPGARGALKAERDTIGRTRPAITSLCRGTSKSGLGAKPETAARAGSPGPAPCASTSLSSPCQSGRQC